MDVQPMTINGHLLLLVLATSVFVRVWNGNRQPAALMPLQEKVIARDSFTISERPDRLEEVIES